MTESIGSWLSAVFIGALAAAHPHAFIGAAGGCFFFLAFPGSTGWLQRLALVPFSFVLGYAFGVYLYGGGPPFSEKAMFPAAGLSGLAAVIWAGLARMAERDGPLPQYVKDIFDRVPSLRRKGPDDGA